MLWNCRSLTGIAIALATVFLLAAPFAAGGPSDSGGYRPLYQGYGVNTSGGRSGVVYKVTNLNDSGSGSLRAALTASEPRFVVFETSGRIQLSSPIVITNPYVTVAGQTAPAPGITVTHHPILISAHDVVFQHFRVRLGDVNYQEPNYSLTIRILSNGAAVYNVVMDHMSVSWSTNTNINMQRVTGNAYDISVLDCIISEGLDKSLQNPGMGFIALAGAAGTLTFARNLLVHNAHRMPWVAEGTRFSGFNNYTYGGGYGTAGDDGAWAFFILYNRTDDTLGSPLIEAVWVSNVTVKAAYSGGQAMHPDVKAVKVWYDSAGAAAGNQLYLSDNTGPHMTLADQWAGVTFMEGATQANTRTDTVPSWHGAFNYSILPNANVKAYVTANSGARPTERNVVEKRDPVDYRVVQDALNNTGSRISSQQDVGGYPTVAVNRQTYNIPANPNSPGTCGTTTSGVVRTIIECDLEAKARALEPGGSSPSTPSPPKNLRIIGD